MFCPEFGLKAAIFQAEFQAAPRVLPEVCLYPIRDQYPETQNRLPHLRQPEEIRFEARYQIFCVIFAALP